MKLKYADFYEELLDARDMKKVEAVSFIESRTGYKISEGQVYEFLEGKHTPNAAMASIWELAFGVNLKPKYYGADLAYQAGTTKGGKDA